MRRSLLLLLAAAFAASACSRDEKPRAAGGSTSAVAAKAATKPPTERLFVVATPAAPLLDEAEDDEPATDVVHAGDLLRLARPLGTLKWRAPMEGVVSSREGPIAEVSRAGESKLFGWRSDLGEEIDAPTAAWICGASGGDAGQGSVERCTSSLRRARRADGAFVAYTTQGIGPCPIVIVRAGLVNAIFVDGVSGGEQRTAGDRSTLLLTSRWVRAEGRWTGGNLVVVDVSGAIPVKRTEIPLDEIDARGAERVTNRQVKLELRGDAVHLTGERREIARADGKELSKVSIDETWPLSGPP